MEIETPQGAKIAQLGSDGVYRLPGHFASAPLDVIATATRKDATEILPLSVPAPAGDEQAKPTAAPGSYFDRIHLSSLGLAGGGFLLGLVVAALFWRPRRAVTAAFALAFLAFIFPALAHEGEDHSKPAPIATPAGSVTASVEAAQRQSDGSLFVPKVTQRIFGVRTFVTARKNYSRSIELPGRIIPDPGASGYVQSAVGGRLSPPPGGFPRLGSRVAKGDVMAFVTPPLAAIDVSDMRQRQGEIDQQLSIVQRRLARFEVLAPSGAVARSQLEDTRLELEGLKDRRAALDRVRRDPEDLVAPVSGVVADGSPVAGQIAQASAIIFHIVDPSSLYVEALSFEPVSAAASASATTPQGESLKLAYRGAGFADRNQSIPVHFAIEAPDEALRVGQFVTVVVASGQMRSGIAVPRSALVRAANGVDQVYEKLSAEIFVPRIVRVEALDAEMVLVASGLESGKRVVTQGSELLDHIR